MNDTAIDNDKHRVVRYAKPSHIDTVDGYIVVTNAAFYWQKMNETDLGLSVNWLDFYDGKSEEEQLSEIRSAMHITPAATGRLAMLEVGCTTNVLQERAQRSVRFVSDPLDPTDRHPREDPSHAAIAGLPDFKMDAVQADLISDLIADYCVSEHFPAKTP